MYKFNGTVLVIGETLAVSEKFSKRELVLMDDDSMYPQQIMFQFAQDKCSMLDGISEGEQVEVSFNLRGREWVNPEGVSKYFNTLDAWRIEVIGSGSNPADLTPKEDEPIAASNAEGDEDLPF